MDASLTFDPAEWVRDIQSEDGTALLDIRNNTCFSVNLVGARIWSMVKLHWSIEQMADSVASAFGISKEKASGDVAGFIRALDVAGLIMARESCRQPIRGKSFTALLRGFLSRPGGSSTC